MENVGEIAGTASSVQGFVSTCCGVLLGLVIGQSFNGTVLPLTLGYFLLGSAALVVVFVTERGKLFRAHHAARPSASRH
jgi:DHA1 family bicyclomycin/chloramphenicol resistance-like MFS transporter